MTVIPAADSTCNSKAILTKSIAIPTQDMIDTKISMVERPAFLFCRVLEIDVTILPIGGPAVKLN